LLALFTATGILPCLRLYLEKLRNEKGTRAARMLWAVISVVLSATALILLSLAGFPQVEAFFQDFHTNGFAAVPAYRGEISYPYFVIAVIALRSIILIQVAVCARFILTRVRRECFSLRHLRDFLFHGGKVSVLGLQLLVSGLILLVVLAKTLIFRWMLIENVWISLLLAVLLTMLICCLSFFALFGAGESVTLAGLRDGFRFNCGDQGGSVSAGISRSADADSLTGRFEKLMFDEQAFLQPGLTLADVADRLHSNKTYISRLVNNTYNLAFPDLLNALRIEYAQRYLIDHRDARQSETATACGFPNASSFNSIFKKVTGTTPKIWLATYDRQQAGREDS
nr:helix-turn-helix transcriptional regulator [Bacteroidales bacterium]